MNLTNWLKRMKAEDNLRKTMLINFLEISPWSRFKILISFLSKVYLNSSIYSHCHLELCLENLVSNYKKLKNTVGLIVFILLFLTFQGLLLKKPRAATILAKEDCEFAVLNAVDYSRILSVGEMKQMNERILFFSENFLQGCGREIVTKYSYNFECRKF